MGEYLRNCWYMAAWSHEVGGVDLFRRRLLGELVLFYRKADGALASMVDRCPHRYAPLSLGQRDGDTVICHYHGLGFGADGKCVRNPFSDTIPKGTDIVTFVMTERDGIIWFWPGEADKADPGLIPDFSMLFVAGHGAPVMG